MTSIAGEPPRSRLLQYGPVALAVAVVVLIGLQRDLIPNLTLDEAFSLFTARRPLADVWGQAVNFELQPPVYFVVLKLWLGLSSSLVWARVLSTTLVVATIFVLGRIARDLGPSARLLPLAVALSPTILSVASYARCYALALLLGALSTLYAIRLLVLDSAAPRRDAAGYAVSSLLLLYTFYFGGFVLAGHAAAALLARRSWKAFGAAVVAITVLFLPWLPTVMMQVSHHPIYSTPITLTGSVSARTWEAVRLTWLWLRDVVTAHSSLIERPAVTAVVIGWWVAVIALRLRRGAARWSRLDSQLLLMAAVPALSLVALKGGNVVNVATYRYMFVATVGTLALATVLSGGLRPLTLRYAANTVLGLFLSLSAVSYLRNHDEQDVAGAAGYVASAAGPTEPVLFYMAELVLPFREVFKGPNALVGFPNPMAAGANSFYGQVVTSDTAAARRLAALPAGTSYWFVMGDAERHKAQLGGQLVELAMSRSATVLAERSFEGLKVWHLRSRGSGP